LYNTADNKSGNKPDKQVKQASFGATQKNLYKVEVLQNEAVSCSYMFMVSCHPFD
jgi:hypothetical protein